MDCLVFLNGHLLQECKSEEEFDELETQANQEDTGPEFSYTNRYEWGFEPSNSTHYLSFVEDLHEGDRVDLVNPKTGKRKTIITSKRVLIPVETD